MSFFINALINDNGESKQVFEAQCVFVAVDKKGRKKKILPKVIETPLPIKPKIT
jgi:acyl-CoA thioesterase FadM